jgi:hypothetical protein
MAKILKAAQLTRLVASDLLDIRAKDGIDPGLIATSLPAGHRRQSDPPLIEWRCWPRPSRGAPTAWYSDPRLSRPWRDTRFLGVWQRSAPRARANGKSPFLRSLRRFSMPFNKEPEL